MGRFPPSSVPLTRLVGNLVSSAVGMSGVLWVSETGHIDLYERGANGRLARGKGELPRGLALRIEACLNEGVVRYLVSTDRGKFIVDDSALRCIPASVTACPT